MKPYTSGELMQVAVEGIPLNPLRVLATYADPGNWTKVYADRRNYWSWAGPTIVGYELAGLGVRAAHPTPGSTEP